MPQIAIIDDNLDQSGTLKKHLDFYLRRNNSDLSVIIQFPFKNVEEYFPFIEKNEICILILDERLNDRSIDDTGPVAYKGNELVSVIREKLKDFPVFMVTSHSDDVEVKSKFDEFEYIISRQDFWDKGEQFTPIIIRSAQRYLKSNEAELSEFDELTKKVAAGDNDPQLLARLAAIQAKLELPFNGFNDRNIWLKEYADHIEELEKLKEELTAKLGRK